MSFVKKFITKLADKPAIFSFLRKIIEFNFYREKKLIRCYLACQNQKILDIGCGTGEFAHCFRQSNYYGIDISSGYIEYARKKYNGNFSVMDAGKLDYANNSFDAVLIMAILHHLSDEKATKLLTEAKRVVKTSGRILIMEDARITSLFNFMTIPIQKMDKGVFIRTLPAYIKLISPIMSVTKSRGFRSGLITYGYFYIDNPKK